MKSRKATSLFGYVSRRKGRWLKDPKPRGRKTIRRSFDTFRKSGSASTVALCQGLVICRVHKSRFRVNYSDRIGTAGKPGRTRVATYRCMPALGHPDVSGCREVPASFVDSVIEAAILSVLQPPSLGDIRDAVPTKRRQDETRLGIREVFHRQHPLLSPAGLNEAEREHLRSLLGALPRLWRHPSVTPQQRRAVIRTVITAIHVTPSAREWTLEIEWVDGTRTSHQLLTPHGTHELITQAFRDGHSCREIADRLNAYSAQIILKGLLTAPRFTEATLRQLPRSRDGFSPKRRP